MAARQCAATAKGLKLLARNPKLTVPKVAKRVGVTPSTLYRALGNYKEKLVVCDPVPETPEA